MLKPVSGRGGLSLVSARFGLNLVRLRIGMDLVWLRNGAELVSARVVCYGSIKTLPAGVKSVSVRETVLNSKINLLPG